MVREYDVVVIGGGIVGLATALETVGRFPRCNLLLLEKENRLAAHQSGRNSGVVHTGLYYRPGSMKALLCVEGRKRLLDFCREEGLPHEVCGKVVVATGASERQPLEALLRRGLDNGVEGLEIIGPERLREIEPHAAGVAALRVPGAAVTDFARVAAAYAARVAEHGGRILTSARVTGLAKRSGGTIVETTAGEFPTRVLVNCGGLFSDSIARLDGADPGVRIVPFRGEYHELRPESRFLVRALIYPVPDPRFPFLGVHLTRRIGGEVEAGPNAVLALKREGYRKADVDPAEVLGLLAYPGFLRMARRHWRSGFLEMRRSFSRRAFLGSLRRLVPELRDGDLRPGGSGVRAQAVARDGRLLDDFHIVQAPGRIHVLNVPSPAATASLAIGRRIAALLDGML